MSEDVKQKTPSPIHGTGLFTGPLLAEGSILAKWDSDRGWHDRDGMPLPNPVFVLDMRQGVRRWQNHELIEEFVDHPLPDVDLLNGAVPMSEWELGLDGKPDKPYSMWFAAYLLDPVSAAIFSYLNNTAGCEIAIRRLEGQIKWMRALRGPVVPLARLADAGMKTQFGPKRRPHFEVQEWRQFGAGEISAQTVSAPQLIPSEPKPTPETIVKQIEVTREAGKPVAPVSLKDDLDDEIPI